MRQHRTNNMRQTTNVYSNVGSVFVGHPGDTHNHGGNPDYDYIDLDELDMPEGQSRDTAMMNGSAGGQRNTAIGPGLPQRTLTVKSVSSDEEGGKCGMEQKQNGMVMVDNDDYDGIGGLASGIGGTDKSGTGETQNGMVMVDNDDYDGIGGLASGTGGTGASDVMVMVDNADYASVETKQTGDEDTGNTDGRILVDNPDYEAVGTEEKGDGDK